MSSAFKRKNERMYHGNESVPLVDNTYKMEILSLEKWVKHSLCEAESKGDVNLV